MMKTMNAGVLLLMTLMMLAIKSTGAAIPKEASPDAPWEDLRAALSSPDLLSVVRVPVDTGTNNDSTTSSPFAVWNEQCVQIYRDAAPFADGTFPAVSNYLVKDQPSGLCLGHVSCAYRNCVWPPARDIFPTFPDLTSAFIISDPNNDFSADDDDSDNDADLNLPAAVVQPASVADIVQAVQFCQTHNIGVTVKVAGHSYFGASSAKNTLLIKMDPNYPKYAITNTNADGREALVQCDTMDTMDDTTNEILSADQMACALATARGKPAVLRVGGGELFDEAYRAVSLNWNSNNNNADNKYHLVGGGAGTVSAAGGWLASGGLSGTTGMRLYGIGIDQVVALEMVLPSGTHVRFAPTEWTDRPDGEEGYPTTTQVTGYCNANPVADESLWEWTADCGNIDFNELWFAARGGGGGSYGVVTSVHYQLHDFPGAMSGVVADLSVYPASAQETVSDEAAFLFTTKYIEFVLRYLYVPDSLNVTQIDSRGCNSALTFRLNPFLDQTMFCYGESATTFVTKWEEFITNPTIVSELQAIGVPDDVLNAVPKLLTIAFVADSYAEFGVQSGAANIGVPDGRMADSPQTSLVPVLSSFPNLVDARHTHVPLDAVTADPVGMSQLLALDVFASGGGIYATGGFVPAADDGLNSLSPTRRNAAFLLAVASEELRDQYYSIFYANMDGDDFPGSSCHNHALVYEMGPLKEDWTKSCPLSWPQSEREEKCISQNEASWGTANLERLETFKAAIDPNEIFICTAGVGYSSPSPVEPDGTTSPTASPDTTSSSPRRVVSCLVASFMLLIQFAVVC